MPIAAKLDEFGKPAWIALTILGFMVWWPFGLAILAFSIGSGRMGYGYHRGFSGGHSRWQHKMDRFRERMAGQATGFSFDAPSSGNRAFDEYRTETIRRLEDEQREFHEFLDRLRMAKDKSEFDQFMAERRDRPSPDAQPQA